jgi:hypothetical protein
MGGVEEGEILDFFVQGMSTVLIPGSELDAVRLRDIVFRLLSWRT